MKVRNNGILYIVSGERHLAEAIQSIESVRHFSEIPITVICDRLPSEPVRAAFLVRPTGQLKWPKAQWVAETPYDRTLCLDTDTIMLRGDSLTAFDLLDRFDMAMGLAPSQGFAPTDAMPRAFPHFNCGVIYYKKNDRTLPLFEDWKKRYLIAEKEGRGDQGSLAAAVYHSDARVAVLADHWNFRAHNAVRLEPESIRILHNRHAQEEVFTGDIYFNPDNAVRWLQGRRCRCEVDKSR